MLRKHYYTPKSDQEQRRNAYNILELAGLKITPQRMYQLCELMKSFQAEDTKEKGCIKQG